MYSNTYLWAWIVYSTDLDWSDLAAAAADQDKIGK